MCRCHSSEAHRGSGEIIENYVQNVMPRVDDFKKKSVIYRHSDNRIIRQSRSLLLKILNFSQRKYKSSIFKSQTLAKILSLTNKKFKRMS